MSNIAIGLLHGMVLETNVESITGKYLYSDFATGKAQKDTTLNNLVKFPLIGIAAGVGRVALGIIHTVGHLLAALVTLNKGHLYHAAKGMCEILRGTIETIPFVGRYFAFTYNYTPDPDFDDFRFGPEGTRSWWMIKIYNPEKPDGLDKWMDNWSHFPKCYYVKA